ncbi:MAG: alpha/beta hydrolase [Alphaproteobacteria bacterium]|nr:alpha/beta hydrolase [Alphaproteobacteria bacterium]
MIFRRPAQSRTVATKRLDSQHYLDWPGRDLPIILLHGNKALSRSWDFVVEASALPNRFLAPDWRGHGLSAAPPSGYRIEDYLADALAWLEHLGIRRAIIVGTSTGGYVALKMASEHPALTRAISVVDSGIWIDPGVNFAPRQKVYDDFAAGRAALDRSAGWPEALKEHYARHSFEDAGQGRVVYRYFDQGETAQSRAAFKPESLTVRCPTLIVRGDRSDITTDASSQRLRALIPGSTAVTLEDCGHHVPMDRPAALALALDHWVRGL